MTARIVVIANPAAGSGRGARMARRAAAELAPLNPELVLTERSGHEADVARAASNAGAEAIVAVGGDGTWGNVANGILASSRRPPLALVAAGTGNDFVKSVDAPARDVRATRDLIVAGATRAVDVGRVDGHAFLNCCGFGFDTAVLERLHRVRGLRGPARYLAAALAELFAYRGLSADIHPWPHPPGRRPMLVAIANGRWYGGMFHIAPNARVDDGLLDAIRIADVTPARRVPLLLAAINGRHVGRAGVETHAASAFTLEFATPPLVNTDGEVWKAESARLEVTVEPRALRIFARS